MGRVLAANQIPPGLMPVRPQAGDSNNTAHSTHCQVTGFDEEAAMTQLKLATMCM